MESILIFVEFSSFIAFVSGLLSFYLPGPPSYLSLVVAVCGLVSALAGHVVAAFKIWTDQRKFQASNELRFTQLTDSLEAAQAIVNVLNASIKESHDRIDQFNAIVEENRIRIKDQHELIVNLSRAAARSDAIYELQQDMIDCIKHEQIVNVDEVERLSEKVEKLRENHG